MFFHELRASSIADGNMTVKVEPFPSSLLTLKSPPINWQNLRDSARPRPVPPYFFEVLASAWLKDWKSFESCSGVIPMPVSLTRNKIWGAHVPRVLLPAPSPEASWDVLVETDVLENSGAPEWLRRGASACTRGACAPRLTSKRIVPFCVNFAA